MHQSTKLVNSIDIRKWDEEAIVKKFGWGKVNNLRFNEEADIELDQFGHRSYKIPNSYFFGEILPGLKFEMPVCTPPCMAPPRLMSPKSWNEYSLQSPVLPAHATKFLRNKLIYCGNKELFLDFGALCRWTWMCHPQKSKDEIEYLVDLTFVMLDIESDQISVELILEQYRLAWKEDAQAVMDELDALGYSRDSDRYQKYDFVLNILEQVMVDLFSHHTIQIIADFYCGVHSGFYSSYQLNSSDFSRVKNTFGAVEIESAADLGEF